MIQELEIVEEMWRCIVFYWVDWIAALYRLIGLDEIATNRSGVLGVDWMTSSIPDVFRLCRFRRRHTRRNVASGLQGIAECGLHGHRDKRRIAWNPLRGWIGCLHVLPAPEASDGWKPDQADGYRNPGAWSRNNADESASDEQSGRDDASAEFSSAHGFLRRTANRNNYNVSGSYTSAFRTDYFDSLWFDLQDGKGRHSAVVHPSGYNFEHPSISGSGKRGEGCYYGTGGNPGMMDPAMDDKRLFFSPAYFEPELLKVKLISSC